MGGPGQAPLVLEVPWLVYVFQCFMFSEDYVPTACATADRTRPKKPKGFWFKSELVGVFCVIGCCFFTKVCIELNHWTRVLVFITEAKKSRPQFSNLAFRCREYPHFSSSSWNNVDFGSCSFEVKGDPAVSFAVMGFHPMWSGLYNHQYHKHTRIHHPRLCFLQC